MSKPVLTVAASTEAVTAVQGAKMVNALSAAEVDLTNTDLTVAAGMLAAKMATA